MKTIIDNTERVFLVTARGSRTQTYFCNLDQLPEILKMDHFGASIEVREFWNENFYKVSDRDLNEMFQSNQINFYITENPEKVFLDFFNNYTTIEKMAEHKGIPPKILEEIIDAGKKEHNR